MSRPKVIRPVIMEETFRCIGCNGMYFMIVFSKSEDKYWYICVDCGVYYGI